MNQIVPQQWSHPPGCSCGCGGGQWGCDDPNWGQDLMQCWNQINQLKCLIKQIMDEVGGPVRTGPIKGVIDGSDAKPGEVGEFLTGSSTISYAAYPARTQTNASPLVVPPGDWDLWVSLNLSTVIGGTFINLSPQPTGVSNGMAGGAGVAVTVGQGEELAVVIGQTARGSFSVPTLLPFSIIVDQSSDAGLVAGNATLKVEARRRR